MNGFGVRPAATPFGLEVGWRKLGEGRSKVVASIVLLFTDGKIGKGEGGPGPRTKAWSKWELWENGYVVLGKRRHRRPGFVWAVV